MNDELKGLLLGAVAVTLFGLTLPATRYISPYMDATFIGLGRACVAAIVAALILLVTKQSLPTSRQIISLLIVALGVVVGFPVLSAWAMQSLPASHGGVVLGILPLATAATSRLISDERPSSAFWLVAIVGSCVVIVYSLLQGGGYFVLADLALIGAVISASLGYALGGKLAKELGGWQVICWALVFSFPFIIWPTLCTMPNNLNFLSISVVLSFLYLALFSQLFGFFIWYKAMALGGVARVSQVQLLQPFITLVASAVVLTEIINLRTVFFAVAVVLLVAIGKRMPIDQQNS